MTLGGFTAETDDLEMQRVVLHEFGYYSVVSMNKQIPTSTSHGMRIVSMRITSFTMTGTRTRLTGMC